ncbi:MAG: methyl-accepting chemotaxis protein [Bacillota bacterium]|nr:methyl-accepting chemotaxis protein [Bacillota bacterium]
MLIRGISTSIKNKLFLLGIIPIILFVLLTVVYTLPSSRNDLFNEKEIQTKELVNVGLSVLTHYHSLESEGRGFAVVADEVRKLAEQSASAASEITELITSTQEQSQKAVADMDKGVLEVNSGTDVIISTGEIFKKIVSGVDSIISQIESVAASSQQISSGSEEMSAAVEEQSATMEEVSASAFELRSAAEKLAVELSRFTF